MNDQSTQLLLDRFHGGDANAIEELLQLHRSRLRRMIQIRLNPLVRSRVDESDILQNTLLVASQNIEKYFAKPAMPFFLWLRWLTNQQINQCHRFHLDRDKRDVRRNKHAGPPSGALSEVLANQLNLSTPSDKAMRNELVLVVTNVMEHLDAKDREILTMRHFEQMTNQEVALALELEPSNASSRYLRLGKTADGTEENPRIF